jgi:phytoene synthase
MTRATFSRTADRAACREMIRGGSRSFYTASLLLPEGVREAAYALYAFCRLSDDAVDAEGRAADAVPRLRARLDGIYAGDPLPESVDRALADAVAQFAIPRTLMDALLEGLEWDMAGRSYDTLSDVQAYGARVAGAVGGMMAALMGARSPDLVARACDLGVAMQLTNIARDVGEDARMGRIYLPRVWLEEAGIEPERFLADPRFSPQLASVIERLLEQADVLYRRADIGIAQLDPAFRPAIFAARHLYAEIGALLARRGLDSIGRRTTVSAGRKLWLLGRAVRDALASPVASPILPPLEETRFLVDAMVEATARLEPPTAPRAKTVKADLIWTVELFSTLAGRERAAQSVR